MKVILASNNKNKIKEIKKMFENSDIEIVGLKDVAFYDEIEENGKTFTENALIKAKTIYDIYKIPVISDDSGIEVDALNGKPGVYSARWSGYGDEANNDKLLEELKGSSNRKANYACVVCYYNGPKEFKFFEGKCYGTIGYERKGEGGFGYDPLFILENSNKTMAEITMEEKNKISHRSIAIKQLADYLLNKNNF